MLKSVVYDSFLDGGDNIGTTLFFSECNFSCPYCHNMDLEKQKDIDINSVLIKLLDNQKLNNQVIFSGGESLLDKEATSLIISLKNMGFKIGLHTNGSTWKKFMYLKNYIDFIGLDFKCWFNKVNQIGQNSKKYKQDLKKVIRFCRKNKCKLEIRTTLYNVDEFNTRKDLIKMGLFLRLNGIKNWYWQLCRTDKKGVWDIEDLSYLQSRIKIPGLKIIIKG